MSTYKRGFTLIELLVVIAIIGLLAAVVLASVGSARTKGVDASVKGGLANMRAQAELWASNHGNAYLTSSPANNACADTAANNGLSAMTAGAASSTGSGTPVVNGAGAYNQVTCNVTSSAWAVQAPLTGSTNTSPSFWCVDSTGASKGEVTVFSSSSVTACPTP